MKKLSIILVFIMLMSGCSAKAAEPADGDSLTVVRVKTIQKEVRDRTISGVGIVKAEETKQLSFKVGGKIKNIMVEKGEKIKRGTPLIKIDTSDLQYALSISKAQMEAAKALYNKAVNGVQEEDLACALLDFEKAKAAHDDINRSYKDGIKLYELGALSNNELEKIKLECDLKKLVMEQAEKVYQKLKNGTRPEDIMQVKASYDMAAATYEHDKVMLEDAVLTSDMDGYVVEILYKEGENVAAGYPAVVVRNDRGSVHVAVSREQLSYIAKGNRVVISGEGKSAEGFIKSISDVPDNEIQSYVAEITFEEGGFRIGEIVKAEIHTTAEEAIWLSVDTIMNDGENYVYIVNDGRIERRNVEIGEAMGNLVKLQGISEGDRVVVENASKGKVGEKVNVLD